MKTILSLFILLCLCSCKKNTQTKNDKTPIEKPSLSVVKEYGDFTSIDSTANTHLQNWKEYYALNEFINRFKKTSANEALSNALELKSLITTLKDSLPDSSYFVNPAFKARIHVLENEILRLTDMTYIPSITSKEVNGQVVKILNAFNNTNQKINNLFLKEEIEKTLNKSIDTLKTKTKNTP